MKIEEIVVAARDQAQLLERKVFPKLEEVQLIIRLWSSTEIAAYLNSKKASISHCPQLPRTVDLDQEEEHRDEEEIHEL